MVLCVVGMGVHDAVAATGQFDKGVEILHASKGESAAHVGGGGHWGAANGIRAE